jgi:type II secretory pathway pseudopilin PulG
MKTGLRRTGAVRRRGATLMEALVAALVLAVMAVAAGGFVFQGRLAQRVQRVKRAAIEAANTRLELARSVAYTSIRPTQDAVDFFLEDAGGALAVRANDPLETVTLYGVARPMWTGVRRETTAGPPRREILRLSVRVQYTESADAYVELQTLRGP